MSVKVNCNVQQCHSTDYNTDTENEKSRTKIYKTNKTCKFYSSWSVIIIMTIVFIFKFTEENIVATI